MVLLLLFSFALALLLLFLATSFKLIHVERLAQQLFCQALEGAVDRDIGLHSLGERLSCSCRRVDGRGWSRFLQMSWNGTMRLWASYIHVSTNSINSSVLSSVMLVLGSFISIVIFFILHLTGPFILVNALCPLGRVSMEDHILGFVICIVVIQLVVIGPKGLEYAGKEAVFFDSGGKLEFGHGGRCLSVCLPCVCVW